MRLEESGQKLQAFNEVTPGIKASAVVSTTGLILHSALPPDMDEDKASAMSAALFNIGSRTLASLACGDFRHVLVQSEGAHLLLLPAGANALMVLWLDSEAYLDSAILAANQFFG